MSWTYLLFSLLLVANSFLTISAKADKNDDELIEELANKIEELNKAQPGSQPADFATNLSKENKNIDSLLPVSQSKRDQPVVASPQSQEPQAANAPKTSKLVQKQHEDDSGSVSSASSSSLFMIVTIAAGLAGFVGILMAGVCYYKFRTRSKAATEVGYPAYGETGPNKERIPSPGDRKLAQSAQMYHYQHQKQQMIAMEKANGDMKHDASDDDSEEDNIEGDYTVYECPGLAPTGEMEVKNPLFRGDETPVNPSQPGGDSEHTVKMPHDEEH